MRPWLTFITVLCCFACASAAEKGTAELPCVADTSVSSYAGGDEADERTNRNGKLPQIKIKHRENQLVLAFDLAALPPRAKVVSATLKLFLNGGKGYALNHVAVSTISTEWNEAEASFLYAAEGKAWGPENARFCDVTFGNYGTVSGVAQARDAGNGWYSIPVAPRTVHALRDSYGLAVQDETGIFAGKFTNIFCGSRESQNPPKLIVSWEGEDTVAPSSVGAPVLTPGPDAGSLFLEFKCGGNDGAEGTALSYEVRYLKGETLTRDNWKSAASLPRLLTPRPKAPGTLSKTFVEGLEPGATYTFGIIARDESGNASELAVTPSAPASVKKECALAPAAQPTGLGGAPLTAGAMTVWAADCLHQVDPLSGRILKSGVYTDLNARSGNNVYNGRKKRVELRALRGEQIDFQVIVETDGAPIEKITPAPCALVSSKPATIPASNMQFSRVWYLKHKDQWYPNAVPDLRADEQLRVPAADNVVEGQKNQSLYVNLFVPHETEPGEYSGDLTITSSEGKVALPIALTVVPLAMPKRLNFEIELNNYIDRQNVADFHQLHRVAHLHRTGYNVLPYSHNGTPTVKYSAEVQGYGATAQVADWTAYDAAMGPLLDGSAFKGLPREGEPLRWSYLPFYENYPMPLYKGYKRADLLQNRPTVDKDRKAYEAWYDKVGREEPLIDSAFSDEWLEGNRRVVRQYMQHFEEKGWTRTKFHVMCNNVPHKGTLNSWVLDEPHWGRDFRALAFFYKTLVQPTKDSRIQVVGRNGVSRPQWQGDRLDEVSEFNDVSREYIACYGLIRRRILERGDTYWCYGGGPKCDKDLATLIALSTEHWCRGFIGILPYWTAFDGGPGAWDKASELVAVLPANHGYAGWVPTMKLKALRRAQQDMELLNMLAARPGCDRWQVARAVTRTINLAADSMSRNPEHPTESTYAKANAEDFIGLRQRVIDTLLR